MSDPVNQSMDGRKFRVHSPSARSSLVFNENTKQWFTAVLMGLSIAVNVTLGVVLWSKYQTAQQSEDLKRYDLDFFKQNDWANLKAKVDTHDALIQAYGLQKAVKDAAKEK